MKHLFLSLISALLGSTGYMQTHESPFKLLRYEEDYSFLKNDTASIWYQKVKYCPLNKEKSKFVTFGSNIRYQYFNFRNEAWGAESADKDGFMMSRFLAHAHLHTAKRVKGFLQIQSSLTNGKHHTSPVDENPIELHQAFVDVALFDAAKKLLVLRTGRQELLYGAQRIVSVREGPNSRQSFDALKFMLSGRDWKVDWFYALHVESKKKILDDRLSKNVSIWGLYSATQNILAGLNLDLYYLGLWKKRADFDDGIGRELRHSMGARVYGTSGGFGYDAEGIFQFGRFEKSHISAWTASIDVFYEFKDVLLEPKARLKTELISGDKRIGDNKLHTFNPLFPRGAYFGLAALIGPANLFDIHPSVTLRLSPTLEWNIDYDVFWRFSKTDGIYAPDVSLIYSGKSTPKAFIGDQVSTDLTIRPNTYFEFVVEFTWFNAGKFLRVVSPGKDILFGGLTLQLTL